MFQACARCEMNAGEDVVEVGGVAGMELVFDELQ